MLVIISSMGLVLPVCKYLEFGSNAEACCAWGGGGSASFWSGWLSQEEKEKTYGEIYWLIFIFISFLHWFFIFLSLSLPPSPSFLLPPLPSSMLKSTFGIHQEYYFWAFWREYTDNGGSYQKWVWFTWWLTLLFPSKYFFVLIPFVCQVVMWPVWSCKLIG